MKPSPGDRADKMRRKGRLMRRGDEVTEGE
jgi:hypothetical protein